jgi:hypothetical protein
MDAYHPLRRITADHFRWYFHVLFLLAVALSVWMQLLGNPLITEEVKGGILDFEFAGTEAAAQAIVADWREAGVIDDARRSLYWDFLFLLVYPLPFSMLALRISILSTPRTAFARTGYLLAWGCLAAGLLDAVENLALLRLIALEGASSFWAALAWGCAAPKFGLLLLTLLYALVFCDRVLAGKAA